MKLSDVQDDLPILMLYYDEVVQILETPITENPRKYSRKEALAMFLETRSLRRTAAHFGVSPSAINQIVHKAFRTARGLAGVTPPLDD